MRKILLFVILLSVKSVFSQPFQISGFVKDGASGDLLPGAHVQVQSEGNGVVANAYGYFSFSASTNVVHLIVSFTGYEQLIQQFVIHYDTVIACDLITLNQIGEVEVKGNRARQILTEEIGAIRLTGREIEKMPTLFGEKDIIKALQLMPGMKMGKEGSSGLYVRGGTPGQNLMLLDGIPVYNVNHLFGFFSVFTPEAVKSVDVYKGAFPARYGGRISSVIDVKMREGNLYDTKVDLTVGNFSSKIVFETPLKKGNSSLLIAARRTYADLLLAPFLRYTSYDGKSTERNGYFFMI